MKKTRVSLRVTLPPVTTAAGPFVTPSSTTAAMIRVTTLRGVYMRDGAPPRSAVRARMTIALKSPATMP